MSRLRTFGLTFVATAVATTANAQLSGQSWEVANALEVLRSCTDSQNFRDLSANADTCTRAAMDACLAVTGNNQSLLNECAADTMRAWNEVVEGLVAEAHGLAHPSDSADFEAAHAAWRASAIADCELVRRVWERGSLQPFEYALCHARHAARRAEDLAYLVHWWGNLRSNQL